jgi:hypothetical protein
MTTTTSRHPVASATSPPLEPLPETVHVTWDTIRTWRKLGYRVSEQRTADWLYLLARSDSESAVYKLVGPSFDGQLGQYRGWRIA